MRERQVAAAPGYAGQLEVDRLPFVVQRRRLEDDGARAHDAGQREHPQEEPVEHHRHVLPVFDHLMKKKTDKLLTIHTGDTCFPRTNVSFPPRKKSLVLHSVSE